MTISRRMALSGASALAVVCGASPVSAATRVAKAILAGRNYRNTQTSQRFLQLLIHQDESGNMPISAEVSIPAHDTAWYAINTMDDTQYRMTNNAYKNRGYRLRWVNAFKTKAGVRYAGCWELLSGPQWHSRHGMSPAEFTRANADFAKHGYCLTYLDTRAKCAAIWEQGDPTSQQVFSGLTQTGYQQQLATSISQGFRPKRVSVSAQSGQPVFAAIFETNPGNAWQAHSPMKVADFHMTDTMLKAQGYRLTDASGCMLGRKPMFSGIWEMI